MPDTLAQAKSINEKAAKSAARRRARLFYEKATRKASRRVPSVTSTFEATSSLAHRSNWIILSHVLWSLFTIREFRFILLLRGIPVQSITVVQ